MNLGLKYRLLVHDKNGELRCCSEWIESDSFVLQFMQHIEGLMWQKYQTGGTDIVIKDTGNTNRTIDFSDSVTQRCWFFCIKQDDNSSTYGIVVGTGDTAVTLSDVALETQIDHGVGAGQLDYGAHSKTTSVVSGSEVDFVMSRTFFNGSGSTITVKEIGIYVVSVDTGNTVRYFCVARDVLSSSQDVEDAETLTVQYTLYT